MLYDTDKGLPIETGSQLGQMELEKDQYEILEFISGG
jgi:hypothetical protein